MANAATISILLEAQTATLQKGIDEAKGAVNQLDANMAGSVAKGMAMFTVALAAIEVALAALKKGFQAVAESMSDLDRQQKMADKIGMTADSMAALGHAAVLAGESAEVVQDAMMRMTKSISEAAERGTGPASKALEELGLNAERLNDLSTEQKLGAIADAMQGVANGNDKMRLAMELFGRQGHVFVNMLSQGSDGLNAMMTEAGRLGLALGDDRRHVEAANDAIARMKTAWDAIVDQFTIALAPVLESTGELFVEIGVIVRSLVEFLMPILNFMVKILARATKAVADFLKSFGFGAGEASTAFAGGLEKVSNAAELASAKLAESTKKADEEAAKAAEAMAARGEAMAKSLATPAEKFHEMVGELNELVRAGAISWEIYNRGVEKAVESLKAGRKVIDDFKTPGIGAVTRSSVEGFSAVQAATRQKQDEERRHREIMAAHAATIKAIDRSAVILSPVHL